MSFKKNGDSLRKQEKWICHWIEVNNFFIFWSIYIFCAFIMNSYHRKSRQSVIYGVQLMKIKNIGVKHWLHCVRKVR